MLFALHAPHSKRCKDGYQVRQPRCVDRITSRVKCSETQLLAFVWLRVVSTELVLIYFYTLYIRITF